MKAKLFSVLSFLSFTALTTGCVTSGTHEAVVNELAKTKKELAAEQDKGKQLDEKLQLSTTQNEQLVTKISAMGQNVEQLLGEKDTLAAEHVALAKEVEQLKRMRAAAEARNAQFRQLLEKLQRMIDSGTLQVKPRNGRLIVQMSSDVLFPPGGAHLKAAAKDAIIELAETIRQIPDRKFEVVGHCDSTPIHSARFASNWELSTQRAVEVVKLMVEAGVPPEMISAAGYAEFDPIAPNDTPENKKMNRRVELVFLPSIDELPVFDVLKK
ncbi:MAG: OmpA family protein [Deltaproteobacteria bacterium]|nr:OmpA family protein [Deltaproteobacteria bacterium]